ncbi:asparagine synthase C-terminal domain-containing protein [Gordonia phosphorivorans]|uniref:Asparagine synthase C-terminal domain-containing protein n=1 Tax=Gordonia phosphorivorans TaxID=1056982 RepID=A0ABV6H8V5_9ACTN
MTDDNNRRYPQTGQDVEYVADVPAAMAFTAEEQIVELDDAADLLISLLEYRLRAVLRDHTGPPGLMLSGGIDSILIAAVAARVGMRPQAITVVTAHTDERRPDDLRGVEVARHYDLPHELVTLTTDRTERAAAECIRRLGVWEMWEVTSAIPNRAAFDRFEALGVGPVFTGAGADALFMGGDTLRTPPDSDAGLAEYRTRVTAKVRGNFTRNRLVPDYYERLLGESAENFIQVFQTEGFWRLAMSIHPELLWRPGPDGRIYDKYLLRYAAAKIGVPEEFVWTAKSPLQVSSGVVGALLESARTTLSREAEQRTYADPLSEPVEHTAVRLYLRCLDGENS